MNIIDKAFKGEWISSEELKAFSENYQKEFGRVKRAIVGNISGGIAGGAAGSLAGPIGIVSGSAGGALLGTISGAATRKYQVVFIDDDGEIDSEVVTAVIAKHACKKVKDKCPDGSKFEAFRFPEDISTVDRYIKTLSRLKKRD